MDAAGWALDEAITKAKAKLGALFHKRAGSKSHLDVDGGRWVWCPCGRTKVRLVGAEVPDCGQCPPLRWR